MNRILSFLIVAVLVFLIGMFIGVLYDMPPERAVQSELNPSVTASPTATVYFEKVYFGDARR